MPHSCWPEKWGWDAAPQALPSVPQMPVLSDCDVGGPWFAEVTLSSQRYTQGVMHCVNHYWRGSFQTTSKILRVWNDVWDSVLIPHNGLRACVILLNPDSQEKSFYYHLHLAGERVRVSETLTFSPWVTQKITEQGQNPQILDSKV